MNRLCFLGALLLSLTAKTDQETLALLNKWRLVEQYTASEDVGTSSTVSNRTVSPCKPEFMFRLHRLLHSLLNEYLFVNLQVLE